MDTRISAADVLEKIERSLAHRTRIKVDVVGTRVCVSGPVASGGERLTAARAAWVTGVTAVRNLLAVENDDLPHRYKCPDRTAL